MEAFAKLAIALCSWRRGYSSDLSSPIVTTMGFVEIEALPSPLPSHIAIASISKASVVKRVCLILGFILCGQMHAADSSSTALSHRLQACETEVEMLKNSISTQQQAREALEKEVSSLLRATRESMADAREGSSQRQKSFDKNLERLSQDLKQLKAHSNELSQTLNDLAKSVQGVKDTERQQGQAIKELEQAMRALTLALGGKPTGKPSPDGKTASYTVKSGDFLEKVARAHGMTLSEIKEINGLTNDTIHPGQELNVRQP